MASGAQDWVARTDILLQSLAEVIQRPRYGSFRATFPQVTATANADTSIVTVTGAGIVWGIEFFSDNTPGAVLMDTDRLLMTIDGTAIAFPTFDYLQGLSFRFNSPMMLSMTEYDPVSYEVAQVGNQVFTWNTSIQFAYRETKGATPTVTLDFYYGLF